MATTTAITCYGGGGGGEGIPKRHDTTYLEYEIPKKLEKKLSALVEKKLKAFKKTCKCHYCKKERSKK